MTTLLCSVIGSFLPYSIHKVSSDRDNEEANRKSGIAYGAGLVLFSSVVAFCGVGWLLDRWLGTKPWLLVLGVVLGAIAGFYQFIRLTAKLQE